MTVAQHQWGEVKNLSVATDRGTGARGPSLRQDVYFALCEACHRETILLNGEVIWPRASSAPSPSSDMPEEIALDYREASEIFVHSPRGAAALLRLALQKLLPHIGATKSSINEGIAELVQAGTVPTTVQQALDAVRVIGNEAVHPGTLDLKDDEATVFSLFRLLNFIVEKAITEPKEIAAIYQSLPPGKLQGIADRDKPKPA